MLVYARWSTQSAETYSSLKFEIDLDHDLVCHIIGYTSCMPYLVPLLLVEDTGVHFLKLLFFVDLVYEVN